MRVSLFAMVLVLAVSQNVFANQTITLINHFDKPLDITITQGGACTPDFASTFSLGVNASATSKVLSSGICDPTEGDHEYPTTYLMINGPYYANAFFSTGIDPNYPSIVDVSGYISKVVSYSWKNTVDTKVIFCSEEFSKEHGSCY